MEKSGYLDPDGRVVLNYIFYGVVYVRQDLLFELAGNKLVGGLLVLKPNRIDVYTYKENGNWRAAVEINVGMTVYLASEGSKLYEFPGMPKNPEEALQHEMGHVDIWVKFIAEIYLIAERLENMESSSHFVIDFWEAVFKLTASTLYYSECYPNNVAHDIMK